MRTTETRKIAARYAAIGTARRQIIRDLRDLKVEFDETTEADVQFGLTELLSNAVTYGCGGDSTSPDLRISYGVEAYDNGRVRVWVADPSPTMPQIIYAGTEACGGRGLAVLSVLAEALDWYPDPCDSGELPRAKIVWFEVTVGPVAAPAHKAIAVPSNTIQPPPAVLTDLVGLDLSVRPRQGFALSRHLRSAA
ncbi:ATP-binding protein [Kitasatospora sp. NPDC091257]|uniref:ATP-binding protein n=1 Tax=Kitasatospora sp. NPDC091257 TaxID=3364084 RepID=UPI00380C1698